MEGCRKESRAEKPPGWDAYEWCELGGWGWAGVNGRCEREEEVWTGGVGEEAAQEHHLLVKQAQPREV